MLTRRVHFPRDAQTRSTRLDAAREASPFPYPSYRDNGEEADYRDLDGLTYVANYSKGLRHNHAGEVNRQDYRVMLRALYSAEPVDFERIHLGRFGGLRLVNPQAGLAFDLEGPDPQSLVLPPPPRIDSAQNSGEMGELYWMAVARDIPFDQYPADGTIAAAATSLSTEFSDFRGPKTGGAVTPQTIFRGDVPGALDGPYISQFLLHDVPYGTLPLPQRVLIAPPIDFLTDFNDWLDRQRGARPDPNPTAPITLPIPGGPPRYISRLRDLATYVHFDALFQEYLNACLILLGGPVPPPPPPPANFRRPAAWDPGHPYGIRPYINSRRQEGFGTFGAPHIQTLVAEVATRALKTVWFQKWQVHRRLRPEEFGGRLDVHINRIPGRYPMIDSEIVSSLTGGGLSAHFPDPGTGSYLLPQAFEEGAPCHPSYGSDHATVAGACVTILKAWFDESFVLPDPVVPDPTTGYTTLIPAPAATPPLTVGGELNKLAANVGVGRNAAGVHWSTDFTEAIRLGEEIAIGLLEEQNLTYNEDYHLTLTRFDGTAAVIGR